MEQAAVVLAMLTSEVAKYFNENSDQREIGGSFLAAWQTGIRGSLGFSEDGTFVASQRLASGGGFNPQWILVFLGCVAIAQALGSAINIVARQSCPNMNVGCVDEIDAP